MDRSKKKKIEIWYKCITANTSVIWQHAAHTTDQLSSPNCWTGAIQKSLSLNEKYWRIFLKKFRRKGQQAENDKTERVTGLGRRTREELAKWNQMTALRFQTGGRHQTSPASLWPLLEKKKKNWTPPQKKKSVIGRMPEAKSHSAQHWGHFLSIADQKSWNLEKQIRLNWLPSTLCPYIGLSSTSSPQPCVLTQGQAQLAPLSPSSTGSHQPCVLT